MMNTYTTALVMVIIKITKDEVKPVRICLNVASYYVR